MSLDQGILALPFYEPGHRDSAAEITGWCEKNTHVWDAPDRDPERIVRECLRALGADGRLAVDADYRTLCLFREALAYADDLADFAFSIQLLAATPLVRYGDEEQRRAYLPGMADGSIIGAFAVSEEEAGSDISALGMSAEPDGDHYVLNGRKAWIANGDIADLYCVIARTGDGPGPLGLTAFLVPADTPGIRTEPVPLIAPRPFANVVFEDCRVPDSAVLGTRGGGFGVAVDLLGRFRMTVGAAALGLARRAVDAAYLRAKERPIYGGRLLDLQTVQAGFADAEVELNAAALLVARAAWETDRETASASASASKHSSIAKLYATERAQQVVDSCLQLFGAAGLVQDSLTERLYRQIRSLRVYEGPSEVQTAIIAGSLDVRARVRKAGRR